MSRSHHVFAVPAIVTNIFYRNVVEENVNIEKRQISRWSYTHIYPACCCKSLQIKTPCCNVIDVLLYYYILLWYIIYCVLLFLLRKWRARTRIRELTSYRLADRAQRVRTNEIVGDGDQLFNDNKNYLSNDF